MRGPRDKGTPCGVRRSALTRSDPARGTRATSPGHGRGDSSMSLLPGAPREKGSGLFFEATYGKCAEGDVRGIEWRVWSFLC